MTKKAAKAELAEESPSNNFPIVAIGASSGGLEAVKELLTYLPATTGMAYIFIQHLSPNHKSILTQLLAQSTKMQVQEIEQMELMKPNNVYVIPNNKGIEVTNGHIKLTPRVKNGNQLTIDVLFTSLAETHGNEAIGIVLSGNASDGTMGLKAIKQAGGITFAQDNSAKYGSMPESAINEGVADFILSPKEIAIELGRVSKHSLNVKKDPKNDSTNTIDNNNTYLKNTLELLKKTTKVDFKGYKMNTIKRRILRRMLIHKIATIKTYAELIASNEGELNLLYNDLLINVTDFFRDKDTFKYLENVLFHKLLKSKATGEKLRIWVAACSTGQETYSIAIALLETMGDDYPKLPVQIFASDLSEHVIKKARTGTYAPNEVKNVSPERLSKFFTLVDGNYRVNKAVRELCTFAPHNVLSDPPFSKIDFISCCNMLIYFDVEAQKKVLSTFQYSLNDSGYLMLGKSETANTSTFFSSISSKYQIYTRRDGIRELPKLDSKSSINTTSTNKYTTPLKEGDLLKDAINKIVFARFVPAYVIVNNNLEIIHFKGNTAKYLSHQSGRASLNLLAMARPDIAFDLRDAIKEATNTKQEIQKANIDIEGEPTHTLTIDVLPLKMNKEDTLLLVAFSETAHSITAHNKKATTQKTTSNQQINQKLKKEIAMLKANLIALGEEKEQSNGILQAANEEIMTSNEEFQSINEELDTSKEEIECANEELTTINQELQTRNEQLAEAYDFSEAIIATLHEPMLVLDKNLSVKSCNKAFCKNFAVQKHETEGKKLLELSNKQWDIPELRSLLENIIQKDDSVYNYEITQDFPVIGKKTILLNARRIEQKAKEEQLVLLAFTDITETAQKNLVEKKDLKAIIENRNQELEQTNKNLRFKNTLLEQANKDLQTFSYISSHDLQEPLRKISNFNNCLITEEYNNLTPAGKDYLNRMQNSVVRMQLLINDLLSYSQMKEVAPSFEYTDITLIAKNVVKELSETLNEKNTKVNFKGKCQASIIIFQFRQLLFNLINNAAKFAAKNRPLIISINCQRVMGNAFENIGLEVETIYCHLSVTDNGIGFDPKYKEQIFDVFQRLHGYEEYNGTGIGLAICKRIVENHKGIITATSQIDEGAQFDIYLPCQH